MRRPAAIPAVLVRRHDNGTLNQRLAPSGFITRWQPIVCCSVMTTSGSGRGEGGGRAGRWFGEPTMAPFRGVPSTCGVTEAVDEAAFDAC